MKENLYFDYFNSQKHENTTLPLSSLPLLHASKHGIWEKIQKKKKKKPLTLKEKKIRRKKQSRRGWEKGGKGDVAFLPLVITEIR